MYSFQASQFSIINTESFIPHEDQKKLYQLWVNKHLEGQAPSRQDFHPKEMINLLPKIMLIELGHHGPNSIYCRLAGTAVTEIFQCEPTGQNFLIAESQHDAQSDLIGTLSKGHAVMVENLSVKFQGRSFQCTVFALPLFDKESGRFQMALCHMDAYEVQKKYII